MSKPQCDDCRVLQQALRDLARVVRPIVDEHTTLSMAGRAELVSAWHEAKMVLLRRGVRV